MNNEMEIANVPGKIVADLDNSHSLKLHRNALGDLKELKLSCSLTEIFSKKQLQFFLGSFFND